MYDLVETPNCWFSHVMAQMFFFFFFFFFFFVQAGVAILSHVMRKPTIWFPNRSDANLLAQSQKKASSVGRRRIVLSV